MAFRKGGRSRSGNNIIMTALGGLVALVLSLWVFNEILDVVIPLVNDSTYFATAVSFVQSILPVVGIIAAFLLIRGALKKMSL